MRCPSCSFGSSKVVDSRMSNANNSIRRRRECESCKFRFTTFERLQSTNFFVKKRNGSTEPYDRDKLEKGILLSCVKRPIDTGKIKENLNELEEKWGREQTVSTQKIGKEVLTMLKELDRVAFIRFASVYRDFEDLESFETEVKKLLNE
ncbi:transcriptional regulator NrdR [bacterium DOLZORAL124_38_8]|nr:MAG: transcriptional regulator NrdR [bacterium DOLZORAL124_38_8]